MDQDDPSDWSIDRVIQEICHNQSPSWATGADLRPIANPEALSQAFKANDIDGDNLLALEDKDIKSDLGVISFGQRRAIRNVIEHLRTLSSKYQSRASRMSTAIFATPQLSHASVASLGRDPSYPGSAIRHLIENEDVDHMVNDDANEHLKHAADMMSRKRKFQELDSTSTYADGAVLKKPGHPDLTSEDGIIVPVNNLVGNLDSQGQSKALTFHDSTKEPAGFPADSHHTLLNTLDSAIDHELDSRQLSTVGPATADQNTSGLSDSQPRNVKPMRKAMLKPVTEEAAAEMKAANAKFRDLHNSVLEEVDRDTQEKDQEVQPADDGPSAKRIKNDNTQAVNSQDTPSHLTATTATGNNTDKTKSRQRHKRRDQVMCEATETTPEKPDICEPDLDTFFVCSRSTKSAGRMHRGIPQAKSSPVAKPSPHDQANLSNKPLTQSAVLPSSTLASLDLNYTEVLNGLSPELQGLLRRNPVNFNEPSFPAYMESDEEDIIWDQDTQDALPSSTSSSNLLSRTAIDTIIDKTFDQFRLCWRDRSLPKVQVKAHKRWMAAAKSKFIHASVLRECQALQRRFSERIQQHRDGIHLNEWRKAEDVKQQCFAIEATVEQLEEYSLYVNVLKNEQEPSLPSRKVFAQARRPRARAIMDNGDEELESDADSFIVSDDVNLPSDGAQSVIDPADAAWNPIFAEETEKSSRHESRDASDQHTGEDELFGSVEDVPKTSDAASGIPQWYHTLTNGRRPPNNTTDLSGQAATSSKRKQRSEMNAAAARAAERNPLAVPVLTDSDSGSDFERPARLPPTKYREHGTSRVQAIDLTRSSSPSRSERNASPEIYAPSANIIDSSDDVLSSSKKIPRLAARPLLKHETVQAHSIIYNVKRVQDMDWEDIEQGDASDISNSRLALAKAVYSLSVKQVHDELDYIKAFRHDEELVEVLQNGLVALKEFDEEIADVEKRNQENARTLAELLVCYATSLEVQPALEDIPDHDIDDAYQLLEHRISEFRRLLDSLLQNYTRFIDSKRRPSHSSDDILADAESDLEAPKHSSMGSALKRRKRKVNQSKDVLSQQVFDQNRARKQEEKRARMLQQQSQLGHGAHDLLIPISINEPLVYLDPKLAARVKPHQVSGIRFMWREIVENPRSEGCLLAHTMGLGKTMQVISLLACIASCNASLDEAMRNHIPKHLQKFRTLIICPFALIENWFEELSVWLPDPMMLGVLIKLDNFIRHPETTIRNWLTGGGVLIMSYERYRGMVLPPAKTELADPVGVERRRRMITDGPDIVIADEAHRLKNADSKINQAARQIRTKSRIALTGSPLNNHLEEYHTMIEWISPGYLGNMIQFRARYVEPINRGLYSESTSWERKTSMKRLHMLKKIIGPKIDRADITAISKDLPPKVEFFLTIDLTKEQKEAYKIFVEQLRASSSDSAGGKLGNTRVWTWLSVLSLLLNHPSCFVKKLQQAEDSRMQTAPRVDSDDEDYDGGLAEHAVENVDIAKQPVLAGAMKKVMDVFAEARVFLRMEDPSLSHKSMLIKLIIEEAVTLNEKTLIFSKSIPTLNYYESMIRDMGLWYKRIDGQANNSGASTRQKDVADFNAMDHYKVFLISTRAGGLGLNIQSATRVIISDFDFNPTWEQQAVGRAYRIGQKKPVFVYRFLVGGTFEELIHNKAVFKTQLFTRVVDEKNVISQAAKKPGEFLFDPKDVPQENLDDCRGKDPNVLDHVLSKVDCVRNIFLTETFLQDDDEKLDEQELKEANDELELERLERDNPQEYARRMQEKRLRDIQQGRQLAQNVQTQQSANINTMHSSFQASGPQTCTYPFTPTIQVPQYRTSFMTTEHTAQNLFPQQLPSLSGFRGSYDDMFVGRRSPYVNQPPLRDDQTNYWQNQPVYVSPAATFSDNQPVPSPYFSAPRNSHNAFANSARNANISTPVASSSMHSTPSACNTEMDGITYDDTASHMMRYTVMGEDETSNEAEMTGSTPVSDCKPQ